MEENEKNEKERQSRLPFYLSLVIIATLILLYHFVPSVQEAIVEAWEVLTSGDSRKIADWAEQFGLWGPLIIVLAMIAQMFLFVIPSPILMVVAIIVYGPYMGAVVSLVAIFCASSVGYGIGAYFGSKLIDSFVGSTTNEKIQGFLEKHGFWAVVISRISPFLSNDAVSFVGGSLKMGYWRFIAATMAGVFPLVVLIAVLRENYENMTTGLVIVGIISILGFLAYIWWEKRREGDKGNRSNSG